jgi:hypothetical protein
MCGGHKKTFVETTLAMSDNEVLLQAIWEYGSPKAAMDVAKRTQKVIEAAIKSVRTSSISGGLTIGKRALRPLPTPPSASGEKEG